MIIAVFRGPLPLPLGEKQPPGPAYDAVDVVALGDLPRRAHSSLARKLLAAAGVLALAKAPRRSVRSQG
jgi:hypothetical protein